MVRVAGLHDQIDAGIQKPLQDGRTPTETINEIRRIVREHSLRQSHCLDHDLRPALAEHGIRIVRYAEVDRKDRKSLDERFRRQIFPVLTPLAVGLGRPFPYISNLSLSLGVMVRDPVTDVQTFARVKVPKEMLPRFVPVDDGRTFVPLEDVIAENLDSLFPGMEILDRHVFRVTRDADFTVSDEADDLLQAVEEELRARRFAEAVRVEVGAGMSEAMLDQISRALEVDPEDVYRGRRPARPQGPLGRREDPRPLGAARHPVDAGDAIAAAARRGRAARRAGRDAQARHPAAPPVRLVRDLRRALRRAGGQRSRRARDQADRVPDERRLAAGARADPRRRARQAGGLPGRGQGALRRAREHPVGPLAGGGGRARRLRPAVAEDARQVHPRRPPRGRRHPPLPARRHRQLQRQDRPPVHGLRPADVRRGDRRRRRRHVQLPHRLRPPARLPARPRGARAPAPGHHRGDRAHDRRPSGGPPGADPDEDELPGGQGVHPGALPRVAGRRAGGDQHPRHLLPQARRPGRLGQHPRRLDRRPLPRALADLRVRARRRVHGLHRLGRPDAAQPGHARRAADAAARRDAALGPDRHAGPLLRRRRQRVGARRGGQLHAPHAATASRAACSAS